MTRYIDANALLKAMDTWDKFGFSHSGAFVREPENDDYVPYVHYADMVKCVEGMPTADVMERKKGKWKEWNDHYSAIVFCSECGYEDGLPNYHFCPNFGAEMGDYNGEIH